jgi:ABC-2 type transport system ATP-binding protein
MGEPVIRAQALGRRFGDVRAVEDLSLEVPPGAIFGVLGHNGAGKTTTVRLLNGVLSPTAGQARVLGLDPTVDGPALRRRTGVLTETPSLDERLTGRDILRIFADVYGVPRAQVAGRVDELLTLFELADAADTRVGGYSKGMRQRMALARTLLHDPEVLFLDEPTSGLDPVAARQVNDLVARLSRERGHTVFLCTHNLVEAQRLCDQVAVLEHGRLIALGTPAELARQYGRAAGIEIEVDPGQSAAAAAVLRGLPGLRGEVGEGGVLRVTGVPREGIPDMLAALVAGQIKVYRVTPREPTLEDVYFALHA